MRSPINPHDPTLPCLSIFPGSPPPCPAGGPSYFDASAVNPLWIPSGSALPTELLPSYRSARTEGFPWSLIAGSAVDGPAMGVSLKLEPVQVGSEVTHPAGPHPPLLEICDNQPTTLARVGLPTYDRIRWVDITCLLYSWMFHGLECIPVDACLIWGHRCLVCIGSDPKYHRRL